MERRVSLTGGGQREAATFAIPMQIIVRIGGDAEEATRRATAGLLPEGESAEDAVGLAESDAVTAAIALARRNRDLSPEQYYDEAGDAADRQEYYQHIDAAARPPALYTALSALLTDTHRTRLGYSPSVHLYPEVDLQPNGMIESIYSARQMDPVDLIRADAEVDRARRAALRVLAMSRTLATDDVAVYLNRLEAAFPYNCEHVVPQSWFAKRHPMKGDLHHLFACEIKCNEYRANIPYFDFTPDAIRRPDCGRAEPGKFEPAGHKGAVARATLYFLLRYPGEIDNNDREYTRERLNVLLQWHRENPVDLHERHRNRTIQRKQGNRNPVIDHPEWAERIEWSKGLR
jgi:endonuclease G, mitochondrial